MLRGILLEKSNPDDGSMLFVRLLSIAFMLVFLVMLSNAKAGDFRIRGAAGSFSLPVMSLKEIRWAAVIPQQYDYSCGSAAVATLLTFHYGQSIREEEVFQAMFSVGDKKKIRTKGFSMLDMKQFLDKSGLRSDGFRMTLDQVAETGVPGITLINTNGYKHFVVIKGVKGARVLVGHPARGTVAIARTTFETIWNGAVLAALEEIQTARKHFNNNQDWRVWPNAPLGEGVSRTGLGAFTLTLPGRTEFGR